MMKPHISLPFNDDVTSYSLGLSTSASVVDQKRNVIEIKPGLHTTISVTPQSVETSDGFNDRPFYSRNCKVSHEAYGLKLVKKYTKISCEHECAYKKAVSKSRQ